jgi:Ni/Co efflux regulator RcnB
MTRITNSIVAALALALAGSALQAQERGHEEHPEAHPQVREAPRAEPHPGPTGYQRVTEPKGWNQRPAAPDRAAYQHNFQAARAYKIGPYHHPSGWVDRHWAYGQILPRSFWAAPYVLADYWLFSLEVPPAGFEWVRVGNDAMLVNIGNGEILQAEYGVFG